MGGCVSSGEPAPVQVVFRNTSGQPVEVIHNVQPHDFFNDLFLRDKIMPAGVLDEWKSTASNESAAERKWPILYGPNIRRHTSQPC
jgi:hypothetical protein